MSEENNNENLDSEILENKNDLEDSAVVEDEPKVEDELPIEPETKAELAPESAVENVITTERQNVSASDNTVSAITSIANGVIGAGKVIKKPKAEALKAKPKVEKVAIHSTKNVTWGPVGKVYKGYNLVSPEQAEMWLTRDHTRTATPEEVAKEFGK